MDRELAELHRGYHDEQRKLVPDPDPQPDPHDVPGHGRPGGIDDPVPDREYGDQEAFDNRPHPAERRFCPKCRQMRDGRMSRVGELTTWACSGCLWSAPINRVPEVPPDLEGGE